jgi:hypothetical protein
MGQEGWWDDMFVSGKPSTTTDVSIPGQDGDGPDIEHSIPPSPLIASGIINRRPPPGLKRPRSVLSAGRSQRHWNSLRSTSTEAEARP